MRATRPLRRGLGLWGPPLGIMLAIFILSSRPDVPAAPGGVSDKVVHALVYGALAAAWLRAFAGGRWTGVTAGAVLAAFVIATGYGATDELHQALVPRRQPEVLDAIANAIGAAVAVGAGWGWGIIKRFKEL